MTVISVNTNKKSKSPEKPKLTPSNYNSMLGTAQVMVGLFSIGLGPGRTSLRPNDFADVGAAYCLGVMFIFTGVVTLVADQLRLCCTSVACAVVNAIGAIVAVIGIVLYFIDIGTVTNYNICGDPYDMCSYLEECYRRLIISMDITLILATILQLIVYIVLSVPQIKGLFLQKKDEGSRDPEISQVDLREALVSSPQD